MRREFICPDPMGAFSWLPQVGSAIQKNPRKISEIAERCLLDGCRPPPSQKIISVANRAVMAQKVVREIRRNRNLTHRDLDIIFSRKVLPSYYFVGAFMAAFSLRELEGMLKDRSKLKRAIDFVSREFAVEEEIRAVQDIYSFLEKKLGRRGVGAQIDLYVKLGAIIGVAHKFVGGLEVMHYLDLISIAEDRVQALSLLWLVNFLFQLATSKKMWPLLVSEINGGFGGTIVDAGIIPDANVQKTLLEVVGAKVSRGEFALDAFYAMEPAAAIGLLRKLSKHLHDAYKTSKARFRLGVSVFSRSVPHFLSKEILAPSYYTLAAIVTTCAPGILAPLRSYRRYGKKYGAFIDSLYQVLSRVSESYDFETACKIIKAFESIPKNYGLPFGALYNRYVELDGSIWGDVEWLMRAGVKPSLIFPGIKRPREVARKYLQKSRPVSLREALLESKAKSLGDPDDYFVGLIVETLNVTTRVGLRVLEWLNDERSREALFAERKIQHPVFEGPYRYWDHVEQLANSDLEAGWGVKPVFEAATERILSLDPSFIASNLPVKLPPWYKPLPGVRVLKTVGDYYREAQQMKHCARAYLGAALGGQTMLAHIEIDGRPFTLEIDVSTGRIKQMKSVSNTSPTPFEFEDGKKMVAPWEEMAATFSRRDTA